MTGTVLVTANVTDADPGYVGERLVARGFTLRTVLRERGEVPATPPDGTAAVLLLGSEWSVVDPVRPDVLVAEVALVRSAQAAGVPVLGLCYGAQVVAHALGGHVARAPHPEVGLVAVETDDSGVVPPGPWWAFHTDVVSPPPHARVVARNACGVQAFVAPGVVAVQFHPEVRPATLDDWLGRFPEIAAAAGADPAAMVTQARGREDESRASAYALVDAFVALTTSGSGVSSRDAAQPSPAASTSTSP
jgi:GMP synthase-like glutamine amidotransferase